MTSEYLRAALFSLSLLFFIQNIPFLSPAPQTSQDLGTVNCKHFLETFLPKVPLKRYSESQKRCTCGYYELGVRQKTQLKTNNTEKHLASAT